MAESIPGFSVSCEETCWFLEEVGSDTDLSPGLWRLRGPGGGPAPHSKLLADEGHHHRKRMMPRGTGAR